MHRINLSRVAVLTVLVAAFVWVGGSLSLAAAPQQAKTPPASQALSSSGSASFDFRGYVQPYFFPSYGPFGGFGWYGGYYSPFVDVPRLPPAYPYLPNYWWVSPYPTGDPRQAGYNPSSGYPKDKVTTLLLVTYPLKTRVILDGVCVGRSDYLGPIQLPMGEHTLRVEAAGFEPSETVLKVEEPILQQLEVRLTRSAPKDEAKIPQ